MIILLLSILLVFIIYNQLFFTPIVSVSKPIVFPISQHNYNICNNSTQYNQSSLWNDDTYVFYSKWMSILNQPTVNNNTIYYQPAIRSGFSNYIRTLRGLIIFCLIDNRPLRLSWDRYYEVMGCCLQPIRIRENEIPPSQSKEDRNAVSQISRIVNKEVNDSSPHFYSLNPKLDDIFKKSEFLEYLKKKGLIYPNDSYHKLLKRVTKFIFCPNQRIRSLVKSFINKRGNKTMVGVQLRFGGKIANSHEPHTFLLPEKIPHIKDIVLQQINPNTFVYVCSDSSSVINEIREYTNDSIWFMNQYSRGHSKKRDINYYAGAVFDISMLSFSNRLLFTNFSSFGGLSCMLSEAKCSRLGNGNL